MFGNKIAGCVIPDNRITISNKCDESSIRNFLKEILGNVTIIVEKDHRLSLWRMILKDKWDKKKGCNMEEAIGEVIDMIHHLTSMSYKKIWADYDKEADVLYINFTYPSEAVEHVEDEKGIIRNYNERGNIVGVAVISASGFAKRS